ncbi:hypothetical protein LTR62_001934 [Meristemomyces frigidus]|uniref:Uncharacterized protein n=1 Tax=Meristemomyces frigidus TaxID=1508187 RepID=A0AAN7T7T0_9PEZI|nr:hypothetical protein LTR62_001934 [Meristemomyces frigidus]
MPSQQHLFFNFESGGEAIDSAQRRAVRGRATAYSHRVAPRTGLRAAKYKQRRYPQEANDAIFPTQSDDSGASAASVSLETIHQSSPKLWGTQLPRRPMVEQLAAFEIQQPALVQSYSHASKRISQDLTIAMLLCPASAIKEGIVFSRPQPLQVLQIQESFENRLARRARVSKEGTKDLEPKTFRYLSEGGAHQRGKSELLPDIFILGATLKDPFDTYPVPYEDWYGPVLDRFYRRLTLGPQLLKLSPAQIASYIEWVRALEMSHAAIFYTSILLATGTPIATGRMPLSQGFLVRGLAVQAMKNALNDPAQATSNAVISATGKLALHEHLYGDRNTANTVHRAAQKRRALYSLELRIFLLTLTRMIDLRGGRLENLGFPAFVVQLMVWYDTFMANESGTNHYFAEIPQRMGLKKYNEEEASEVVWRLNPKRLLHPNFS